MKDRLAVKYIMMSGMANLYYGKGDCAVDGNVSSITIAYRGDIIIESKLPDGYIMKTENNKLIIEPFLRSQSLGDLFLYLGWFKIVSATATNTEGNKEYIKITRYMDYSELLKSNAEDLTVKSEDLKVTYLHGRTFRGTRVINKISENLNTSTLDKNLYLDNELYIGNYHLHIDGTVMSGITHTENSQILTIGN